MAALLGIVANAMFLDAYGSAWLPVTYIAIGAAGFVVSGGVAAAAQRFDLLGIAVVRARAAPRSGSPPRGSWPRAADGEWVSIPLLVLFPILIQLGFVFIGGQAGRLLDIAGIKASFPRIFAGFPVGAVLGGLLGGQLVTCSAGRRICCSRRRSPRRAFAAARAGRRAGATAELPAVTPDRPGARRAAGRRAVWRPPSGGCRSRFVALIVAYQVLSALGSQLADFLVFDRATAQYPGPHDLARLPRRLHGGHEHRDHRLPVRPRGPAAASVRAPARDHRQPVVLTVFAAVHGRRPTRWRRRVDGPAGDRLGGSDRRHRPHRGHTRTSINAIYQVLPDRGRLSAQTAVEGVGVPVAIAISGVLILVLDALPWPSRRRSS